MVFTESQYFRQWWIVILLLFPLALTIAPMFANDAAVDNEEKSALAIVIAIESLVFLLMWFTHLKTMITSEAITFTFFPYINRNKVYRWQDIQQAYIRKYNPLGEYGGWGLKGGLKSGKAYNVSGNTGLQLVMKDGKKILIGTRKPKEMDAFLQRLKQQHSFEMIQPAQA